MMPQLMGASFINSVLDVNGCVRKVFCLDDFIGNAEILNPL